MRSDLCLSLCVQECIPRVAVVYGDVYTLPWAQRFRREKNGPFCPSRSSLTTSENQGSRGTIISNSNYHDECKPQLFRIEVTRLSRLIPQHHFLRKPRHQATCHPPLYQVSTLDVRRRTSFTVYGPHTHLQTDRRILFIDLINPTASSCFVMGTGLQPSSHRTTCRQQTFPLCHLRDVFTFGVNDMSSHSV